MLLFTVIVFLVTAIGATLLVQYFADAPAVAVPDFATIASTSPATYPAVVASIEGLDRVQRVADMRAKIAQQTVLTEELPAPVDESELEDEEITDSEDETPESDLVACANASQYGGFWDARDLSWVESEGARVLVRGDVSSSSIPETVLQLPKRFSASSNPSCVGSDVIGVANDGSLIRNDEAPVYRIFNSSTLIGYALDGLPIYGSGGAALDACGGHTIAGQYRYELSADRDTVINCFAATPISLP